MSLPVKGPDPLGPSQAGSVVTIATPLRRSLGCGTVSPWAWRSSPAPFAQQPVQSQPPLPDSAPASPGRTATPLYGERAIAEAQLICFDNPRPGRPYDVSIELPEFTCTCPFSGYPDFAVLRLLYQPGPRVLELKALKLYVNAYRDRSISHEEVANRILDDLVDACDPSWMQLEADFNPRGNVHTVVRVSHGQRQPC